jgi:hypothetical protein
LPVGLIALMLPSPAVILGWIAQRSFLGLTFVTHVRCGMIGILLTRASVAPPRDMHVKEDMSHCFVHVKRFSLGGILEQAQPQDHHPLLLMLMLMCQMHRNAVTLRELLKGVGGTPTLERNVICAEE